MPISKTIMLILTVGLIVLAWPALRLWHSVQVRSVYAEGSKPAPPIAATHVAAIRKLRFAWNARIESGGPVVDPVAPYGHETMADDLGPIIGTRDPVAIARFHREVAAVLIDVLRRCKLPPGRYRLAHLDNASMARRLSLEMAGLPPKRIATVVAKMPRLSPDRHFDFTEQHQRLLAAMQFEWPDDEIRSDVARGGHPVPTVDFKRPFGELTAFDIDMAKILGRPSPPRDRLDPVLDRLYWEMWPALQTFVEHAPLDHCTH